jgi:excisionase family DNA binding protein
MHDYFGPRPENKLTPPQLAVCFQELKERASRRERLPDIRCIAHKAEAAASRVATAEAKARHLGFACAEIDHVIRKTSSRFHELEAARDVDDPEVFWNYVDEAQQTRDALSLKIEKLRIATEHEATSTCAVAIAGEPTPAQPTGTKQPTMSGDNMNVEEVAAYLRVSVSTVYHRSASGSIPVNRIGTRLVFRKSEIAAWLQADTIAPSE